MPTFPLGIEDDSFHGSEGCFNMRISRVARSILTVFLTALLLVSPMSAQQEDGLTAIKDYLTTHIGSLEEGAANYQAWAQSYYELAEQYDFDYQAVWDAEQATLPGMLEEGRTIWRDEANANYEMAEGLVAGVPSLAEFDVWIDAGPTGEEDATNAKDWTLETSDGREFAKPGNIFHSITEPTLWGTNPEFVGMDIDMNGDGTVQLGESLPDAHVLTAGADVLVDASGQLADAANDWEPTLEDAFTALVVMIPTAQEYFEQWRDSPYVSADGTEQDAFVGTSRLVDVAGIFTGLELTWSHLSPLVAEESPELAEQITTDMSEMVGLVNELKEKEAAGTRFTPEQADEYGQELQARGESVAGSITQAAALVGVDLEI